MLRSPLPHAPARARRGCPYTTCGRDTACMRASQVSAASTTASAPSSMVGRAGRAVVGAVGEAAACERADCVWRCAGDLHRAIGGQRPRAYAASSCAIASSASSESPVVGHHSGRRRAGAAHATDVHPPATAAYAIAAAAAVPPLPLQPPQWLTGLNPPSVSVFRSLRSEGGGFIQHLPDAQSLSQAGQSALVRGWVCLCGRWKLYELMRAHTAKVIGWRCDAPETRMPVALQAGRRA
jgi:hypothetical protein